MRMDKAKFKHIEEEISLYHQSQKQLARLKDGSAETTAPALYMIKRIQNLEAIVEAIDTVYHKLPPYKQKLVELLYWSEPRLLTFEGIAQQINASRRMTFSWRDQIIKDIANQLGW
jgi:RinA family phage transcriptional activator